MTLSRKLRRADTLTPLLVPTFAVSLGRLDLHLD
jgi:hypothetical protein